ncbi:MAG TPA: hypothetical protein VIA45_07140 [Thermoanaerobaculia bacterium]|jgi:hypothetical protein
MKFRIAAALAVCLNSASLSFGAAAASPPPVLRLPGGADKAISREAILGPGRMDVRREGSEGDVTVFHGQPLLDVLEKGGLETKAMASQRHLAPAVAVVTARDGYTVVFSVGELLMHRADPRVFLVAESSSGPLPENEGPVRLLVYGDRARSAYGLARVEVKLLAENPAKK